MASNREHQRAYRARRLWGDLSRLNTYIDQKAKSALDGLAGKHGLTQKAMLEKLILEAARAEKERAEAVRLLAAYKTVAAKLR